MCHKPIKRLHGFAFKPVDPSCEKIKLLQSGSTCMITSSVYPCFGSSFYIIMIENCLLLAGRNTAVKPYNLTGSFAPINVTSTVYGNVPATPPALAPAPAPAPALAPAPAPALAPAPAAAGAPAVAAASAPAPGPSSDLPCPCALPSGYNASALDLAGKINCRFDNLCSVRVVTCCPHGFWLHQSHCRAALWACVSSMALTCFMYMLC